MSIIPLGAASGSEKRFISTMYSLTSPIPVAAPPKHRNIPIGWIAGSTLPTSRAESNANLFPVTLGSRIALKGPLGPDSESCAKLCHRIGTQSQRDGLASVISLGFQPQELPAPSNLTEFLISPGFRGDYPEMGLALFAVRNPLRETAIIAQGEVGGCRCGGAPPGRPTGTALRPRSGWRPKAWGEARYERSPRN